MTEKLERRYDDDAFHRIAHALGHPFNPLEKSNRNYFCTHENDKRFEESSYWDRGGTVEGSTFYHVNDKGRKALAAKIKQMDCKYRLYEVTIDPSKLGYDFVGHEATTVAACSHSKARYELFLRWSDTLDVTFKSFQQAVVSVRLSRRPS